MFNNDRLPEPYDTEVNNILKRLRASLFGLVELSMQPHQQDVAKRKVKEFTIQAIHSVRSVIREALAKEVETQ